MTLIYDKLIPTVDLSAIASHDFTSPECLSTKSIVMHDQGERWLSVRRYPYQICATIDGPEKDFDSSSIYLIVSSLFFALLYGKAKC